MRAEPFTTMTGTWILSRRLNRSEFVHHVCRPGQHSDDQCHAQTLVRATFRL